MEGFVSKETVVLWERKRLKFAIKRVGNFHPETKMTF